MISRNLVTVPNSPPQPTKVLGVTFPSSVFLCTLCAFSVHYTVYSTDYLITHYTSYDHYGRGQQLTNWRSDHSGKVCLPEGYYRLTGQCENTISSAFKKLQSNNPLLLLNLNKFWRLAEGGKRDSWGVIALSPPWLRPSPTLVQFQSGTRNFVLFTQTLTYDFVITLFDVYHVFYCTCKLPIQMHESSCGEECCPGQGLALTLRTYYFPF